MDTKSVRKLAITKSSGLVALLPLLSVLLILGGCGGKGNGGAPVRKGVRTGNRPTSESEVGLATEQILHAQTLVAAVVSNINIAGKPASKAIQLPPCVKSDEDGNPSWALPCGAWDKVPAVQAKVLRPIGGSLESAGDSVQIVQTTKERGRRYTYTYSNVQFGPSHTYLRGSLQVTIEPISMQASLAGSGLAADFTRRITQDSTLDLASTDTPTPLMGPPGKAGGNKPGGPTAGTAPGSTGGKTQFSVADFRLKVDRSEVTGIKLASEGQATRVSTNGAITTNFSLESDENDGNKGYILLQPGATSMHIHSGKWIRHSGAEHEEVAVKDEGFETLKKASELKCKVLGFCAVE